MAEPLVHAVFLLVFVAWAVTLYIFNYFEHMVKYPGGKICNLDPEYFAKYLKNM